MIYCLTTNCIDTPLLENFIKLFVVRRFLNDDFNFPHCAFSLSARFFCLYQTRDGVHDSNIFIVAVICIKEMSLLYSELYKHDFVYCLLSVCNL